MKKLRLFISHISEEGELANLLKKRLSTDFLGSLDIFASSDRTSIPAGTPWLSELSLALAEAKIEIILCSRASVGRPWVNFEAGAGWIRGIRVIPACYSGMKPSDLPKPLNMLQAIEVRRPEGLKELYEAIAGVLGMQSPKPDFGAMAQEIQRLEEKFKHQDLEHIDNPLILCAASAQYAKETDFELDVGILERIFPGRVIVERQLTAGRLRDLLAARSFSIIHLVVAVDAENGDLLFSPIDSKHKPITSRVDKMSAEGFAALLTESKTCLVVLATCYALEFAVEVARVANIIATKLAVNGQQVAEWSEWFYDLLAKGRSLHKAFEITQANIDLPMKLIRHKDLGFSITTSEQSERNS